MTVLRVVNASSRLPVITDADGAFVVYDQQEYLVQADDGLLRDCPPVLRVQAIGGLGILSFDNYVGLAEVLGQRFRVVHGKLTQGAFERMLDGVVGEAADLAFDFGSPTSLPFERDVSSHPTISYHALAYLRHVMCRAEEGERLLGQFLQIARNPHRRIEHQARWTMTTAANSIGPQGILAVASHPERLGPLSATSRLLGTGLGRKLTARTPLFPLSVIAEHRAESFDTHENRLVKHVIAWALEILRAFDARSFLNPSLRIDLRRMCEELEWMATFSLMQEVGDLTIVPFQSSVTQRREGYREFLGHYVQLGLAATLAPMRDAWRRLLDLKDGALLYEIWAFFEVKRVLDRLLGRPASGELTAHTEERRAVPWSAWVTYSNGIELSYNRHYGLRSGSFSVPLRPDIVVHIPRAGGREILVLDAKLKFDGHRVSDVDPDEDWDRSPARRDLYKMHTYRDALRDAVGAFILYPGSRFLAYPVDAAGPSFEGVGAVPLVPGEESEHLVGLLRAFIEG